MSKVKSIERIGKKPVYNLYVEDTHNFLIQGNVVSHNCDAVRYLAIYWTTGASNTGPGENPIKWRPDMYEDYENASLEDRVKLIERWGEPN
jgi:hypothetical protein